MYDKVFKRIEQKYVISKEEMDKLFSLINTHLERDNFYKSTVCNIYFDTINNDLIINSIEKPIYKDKIRIRSYNVPTLNDDIFLEIKSKYKSTVGKRRIKLKLEDFNNKNYPNSQIKKEITYLFNYYKLVPKIFIAYDRLSYKDKDNYNFRITFDSNLRSRRDNLNLDMGDQGEKYFDKDMIIMEIKSLDAIPLWFCRCLSKLKIYPTSFSKYGAIYKKEIKEGSV